MTLRYQSRGTVIKRQVRTGFHHLQTEQLTEATSLSRAISFNKENVLKFLGKTPLCDDQHTPASSCYVVVQVRRERESWRFTALQQLKSLAPR